jgi:hypothetical protein
MTEPSGDVRALVELIAKSLVDSPDEVFVEKFDDDVIELEVAESDVGKVIGRGARSCRRPARAAGHRAHSGARSKSSSSVTVSPESKGEFITWLAW